MANLNMIKERIYSSIEVKQKLASDEKLIAIIQASADAMINTFKHGGKVLFCGNGGSAADAQHLAAELSGRFYFDRPPLPAEAAHVNTSFLTAVANDYSFEEAYARYVRSVAKTGDILVAISTSGNSANILKAIDAAKEAGMVIIGMTGAKGGKMKEKVNLLINIPSDDTPRIQESHILAGHIICEIVEQTLFGKK
jgi:D-sedoheptulose 7-phosphate isomerase